MKSLGKVMFRGAVAAHYVLYIRPVEVLIFETEFRRRGLLSFYGVTPLDAVMNYYAEYENFELLEEYHAWKALGFDARVAYV